MVYPGIARLQVAEANWTVHLLFRCVALSVSPRWPRIGLGSIRHCSSTSTNTSSCPNSSPSPAGGRRRWATRGVERYHRHVLVLELRSSIGNSCPHVGRGERWYIDASPCAITSTRPSPSSPPSHGPESSHDGSQRRPRLRDWLAGLSGSQQTEEGNVVGPPPTRPYSGHTLLPPLAFLNPPPSLFIPHPRQRTHHPRTCFPSALTLL